MVLRSLRSLISTFVAEGWERETEGGRGNTNIHSLCLFSLSPFWLQWSISLSRLLLCAFFFFSPLCIFLPFPLLPLLCIMSLDCGALAHEASAVITCPLYVVYALDEGEK